MATAQELLAQGYTPREIRVQQIAQRRGVPQMEAEKKAAERFRSQQFGNINDYKEALDSLDPKVARRVAGFKIIKAQQDKRISTIDSKIQQAQQKLVELSERINRYEAEDEEDRADRVREDVKYYKAKIQGLKEGKGRLEKGDIIEANKIESYATKLGNQAEREARAKRERREAIKKAEQFKQFDDGSFQSGGIVFDKYGDIKEVKTQKGLETAQKFSKPMIVTETQTQPKVLGLQDLNRDRSGDGWEVNLVDQTRLDDSSKLYIPQLGGFAETSQVFDSGSQQTLITSPATMEESQRIQEADFRGEILSESPATIISRVRQYQDLTSDISEVKDQEELDRRKERLKDIGAGIDEEGNITPPQVGVGFGMDKEQISIFDLDTRRESRVVSSVVAKTAGLYAKKGAEIIGIPDEGLFQTEAYKTTIQEPIFGTIQTDFITGKEISFKEKDIEVPETQFFTPSQIGGTTEFITRAVSFAPEEIATIGETIADEGSLIGGGLEYIKESPIEAATIGLLGTAAVVGKGVKALRLTKGSKYLDEAEAVILKGGDDITQTSMNLKRIEPRIQLADDVLSEIPIQRGGTRITESFPKGSSTARVKEIRRGSFGRTKEFEGIIKYTDDAFEETLNLGDDLFRRRTVKSGKGKVQLIKNGEIIREEVIKNVDELDDFVRGTGKKKIEKIIIDEVGDAELPSRVTSLRGGDITKTKRTGPSPKPTKDIQARFEFSTETFDDLAKSGRFRAERELAASSQITEIGPRTGVFQVGDDAEKVLFKKFKPQKIERGLDDTVERVVLGTDDEGRKVIKKLTKPDVKTKIDAIQGTEFTEIYLKQGTKSQKARAAAEKARVAAAKRRFKEADFIRDLIDDNARIQDDLMAAGTPTPKTPAFVFDEIATSNGQKLVTPSYVGGEGGPKSVSKYAQQAGKFLDEIPEVTKVPQFQGVPRKAQGLQIPNIKTEIVRSGATSYPLGAEGVISEGLTEFSTNFKSKEKVKISIAEKSLNKLSPKLQQKQPQDFGTGLKDLTASAFEVSQVSKQQQKLQQKQSPKTGVGVGLVELANTGNPLRGIATEIPRIPRAPKVPVVFGFPRGKRKTSSRRPSTEASIREATIFPVGFTASFANIRRKIKRSELGRLARDPLRAIGIRALPDFESTPKKKKTRKLKKKKVLRKQRSEVKSILP